MDIQLYGFELAQVKHADRAGDDLTAHRGNRRAGHAPVRDVDQHGVEDDVEHRAREH